MAGNGHAAGPRRVVELAMTSNLSNLEPAFTLDLFDDVSHLHTTQRSRI